MLFYLREKTFMKTTGGGEIHLYKGSYGHAKMIKQPAELFFLSIESNSIYSI